MTMRVRLGGAWKEIVGGRVFANGAWRVLKTIKVFADDEWRDVAGFSTGPLSVTISPTFVEKRGSNSTLTTVIATAIPTGGITPYTYSWVRTAGTKGVANNPTSAVTTFTATGMAVDEYSTNTFRVTVTDAVGTTATKTMTVIFYRLEQVGTGGTL